MFGTYVFGSFVFILHDIVSNLGMLISVIEFCYFNNIHNLKLQNVYSFAVKIEVECLDGNSIVNTLTYLSTIVITWSTAITTVVEVINESIEIHCCKSYKNSLLW